MTDKQRIKKVINWLIFNEHAENETGLAKLLGYTKSLLSQIINGRVPLSAPFVDKLVALDKNINKVWVLYGRETMFIDGNEEPVNIESEASVTIPTDAWELIKSQQSTIENLSRKGGASVVHTPKNAV